MNTESRTYVLLALLLASSNTVLSQDAVDDKNLESLLKDDKSLSAEVQEISGESSNSTNPTATSQEITTDLPTADTVDITATPTDMNAEKASDEVNTSAETSLPPVEEKKSEETNEATANSDGEVQAVAPMDTEKIDSEKGEGAVESTVKTEEDTDSVTIDEKKEDIVFEKKSDKIEPNASDELEEIKADIGEDKEAPKNTESAPVKEAIVKTQEPAVFDVGREERDLLGMAQNIQGQITDPQWSEVATAAKIDTYTVVKDDWLFKISKRLFGSGYYYPKIWSLNSFITNPHFIEPGMVLSFTTGSSSQAPEVKLGTFTADELASTPGSIGNSNPNDLTNFGEEAIPPWMEEKKGLENQGVFFQYSSEETMDDLLKAGEEALNREYENYDPPESDFGVVLPKNYDKDGFDRSSKILYSFKEGFYLRTFVSTNIVQDFGSIVNGPDENIFFMPKDRAYIQLDESINALPGDIYSVYSSGGKVKHENSDRQGFKYSIVGHIKLINKIKGKWEVEFIEVSGTPQRGDRITAYTPKIDRITRTYNSRLIEAGIIASYEPGQMLLGYGDVIYLDRGRADGLEIGNVLEVYGFKDRAINKNITDQPTYKLGEMTVITLTDNFATGLVTKSQRDFYVGDVAMTKTKEAHLRGQKAKSNLLSDQKELRGGKALEELDVELSLENLNDDLLNRADKIHLTEDELAELERQEREKSVIRDSEKDLKSLERLENEIEQAEKILNDAKLDEDKLLEQQNLNEIEKKSETLDKDNLDEIEQNLGKRYVDEDLNTKENPYGLTEFDVEEVDELLNSDKKEENKE